MADLAQLDLGARGGEARLRALLEDLIEYHKGVYPHNRLALAVWFGKSPKNPEHNLLELFSGLPMNKIAGPTRVSLLWKTGSKEGPFVDIYATSVNYFVEQISSNPRALSHFFERFEVLYFDKQLLNDQVFQVFNVVTEPPGLMKGWYVTSDEYAKSKTVRNLLASHGHIRPEIGLVKIEESPDFENCRGLLHAEVNQRWLPLSPGGLSAYSFFNDLQDGRPGYFLVQGGSLYRLVKLEVKTAPEYSMRVLEKLRDDRYPEVYLRAVHPPEQAAA